MADRSLKALGIRLAKADELLVEVLGYRTQLARQVGAHKALNGQKIIRLEVERQRLIKVRAWARKHDMKNTGFINAVWYMIIAESCRLQIAQLQGGKNTCRSRDVKSKDLRHRRLRAKLRKLVKG